MFNEEEDTKYWRSMYYKCKKAEKNRIEDSHFYKIALNLSGKREELEQKTSELIDGLGYIEALKQTRKTIKMKKNCKHCSGTGHYINLASQPAVVDSRRTDTSSIVFVDCKFCNGEGWIDEDEEISVPRKYVKDEYFDN